MRNPTFFLATFLAALFSLAAPALAQSDSIVKITDVRGIVTLALPDGTTSEADDGDVLTVGTEVRTGSNAEAVLLFSNGTLLELEPETSLTVVRYTSEGNVSEDDPNFGEQDEETAVSSTLLRIESGEVTAEVPGLFDGSVWEIQSPSGTAGVRGTIVSYRRERTASGQMVAVVGYTDGDGYFRMPTGAIIEVPSGNEIVVGPDGYEIRPIEEQPAGGGEIPQPPTPEVEPDLITPQFGRPRTSSVPSESSNGGGSEDPSGIATQPVSQIPVE